MSDQLSLDVEAPLRFDVVSADTGLLLDSFTEADLATTGTGKTWQEAVAWATLAIRNDRELNARRLTGREWWDSWHALPEALRPVDSRDVVCPHCGARAGVFCKRPSGHTSKESHAGRWDALLAAAVLRATSTSTCEGGDGRGR